MTEEKKEKPLRFKCNPHHYIITGWSTKGGIQNATTMRCCQCLRLASVEELESQEFRDKEGF